jgi:translation initiation factor 2-alpha kinase 4
LDTLEEESEYENKGLSTSNSSRSLVEELAGIDMKGEKQVNNIEHVTSVIPLFFI